MPNQPNFIERKIAELDQLYIGSSNPRIKDFLRSSLLEQREMILREIDEILKETKSEEQFYVVSQILSKIREI